MELSYLDYIKESKNEVFRIDDESMIGYAVTNHCFNSNPIDRYVFSVRNREYFIYSNKDEADEVYNSIERFISAIKGVDSNVSVENYVNSLLATLRDYTDVDAHSKYLTILTTLINRKLSESRNEHIYSIRMDDINEDFSDLISYCDSLRPKYTKNADSIDKALSEFFKELKELNNNLRVGRRDYNVDGEDRYAVYIDVPTYLIVHRVYGFRKLVSDFNDHAIRSKLSTESLKELEEIGFIYISYVDYNRPSNRLLTLVRMDEHKKISIV